MLRQFSDATKEAGRNARAYAANENEENPNLNPKCEVCTFMPRRPRETSNVRWTNGTGKHQDPPAAYTHTHTHTHTHTLSSPRSRKGCLRKRGTRSHRCVHNNTQRHNNTDAESHSPNLIHRTEIRMSHAGCRGYIGRQEHPETQSNTRTYGTKKSSYVHAYIGRDGKWRKRVQT